MTNFTYFWKIKNPQYCTLETGQYFTSPKFKVPQLWNTEWYLKIYPHGDSERCKRNTSFFIHRGSDSGPETVEIRYNISFSCRKRTYSSNHSFKKYTNWGYYEFLPHNLDDCGKSIVIIFEIHCESDILENPIISGKRHSYGKYILAFPIKCFTQTEILYETKSIQQSINVPINGTCQKSIIQFNLPKSYPSLIVELQKCAEGVVYLDVTLSSSAFPTALLVVCEMNVTNCVGRLLCSLEGKHRFIAGQNKTWRLEKPINKPHYQTRFQASTFNKINLKGHFVFSISETISEMVCIDRTNVSCDFVLKVGDWIFDVHKVVLKAASPVFAAMLNNEMIEKESNAMNIVDIDVDTVDNLLSFIYTGFVRELEYEDAKKLFIAGDKYQILPLVDLIRSIIIRCMKHDIICDIIFFADAFNDIQLEKVAVRFIKLNASVILNSEKWATFEKESMGLTNRILKQICLL